MTSATYLIGSAAVHETLLGWRLILNGAHRRGSWSAMTESGARRSPTPDQRGV